jgi:hypothetical protein
VKLNDLDVHVFKKRNYKNIHNHEWTLLSSSHWDSSNEAVTPRGPPSQAYVPVSKVCPEYICLSVTPLYNQTFLFSVLGACDNHFLSLHYIQNKNTHRWKVKEL